MATEGYSPVPVETLGGRCTVIPRAALPLGKSPDCADVKFSPGSVSSRDGLTVDYSTPAPATSLSSFRANDGTQTLICQDMNGGIYKETGNLIIGPLPPPVGGVVVHELRGLLTDQSERMLKAVTLFNKHWCCISDGKVGKAQPFFVDGDWSGVYVAGPEGPSRPPTVTAVPNEAGFIPQQVPGVYAWLDQAAHPPSSWPVTSTTVTFGGDRGSLDIKVGGGAKYHMFDETLSVQRVNMVGIPSSQEWMVAQSKDDSRNQVTFFTQWADTGGAYGLAKAITDVLETTPPTTKGRAVRYAWLMKSGYISQLSPEGRAPTHEGRCLYNVTDLDIGPPGTLARILFVEVQVGAELFHVPASMTVSDNVATSLSGLNVNDAELTNGLSATNGETNYRRLQTISPYAGVCKYNERLVYWGGRGEAFPRLDDKGIFNTSFNGGLYLDAGRRVPSGWVAGSGAGNVFVTNEAAGASNGHSVLFASGGGTGVSVTLTQSANVAPEAKSVVGTAKKYGIRLRMRRGAVPISGSYFEAKVWASGTTMGIISTARVPGASLADRFATFEILAPDNLVMPVDTETLRIVLNAVYDGTVTDEFYIDDVSLYEAGNAKAALGMAAVTKAGDGESLDADTGYIFAGPDDGQDLGCCFSLRGNLYLAKRQSLYLSQDNGQEPLFWSVNEVSSTCGTPSVHGVGMGDGWAIIAGPNGVFLFDGSVPTLLSYDILPDWQRINWNSGEKLWVVVDSERKIVYIGAPVDSEAECNLTYVMDFSRGLDADSRQWTLWKRGFKAGAIMPATAESSRMLFAAYTAVAPGVVAKLDAGRTDDFDGLIPAYYMTAPFGAPIGRSDINKFVLRVAGEGDLQMASVRPSGELVPLQFTPLEASPTNDPEIGAGIKDTQTSLRIGDPEAPVKSWFVTKICAMMKNDVYGFLRGQK